MKLLSLLGFINQIEKNSSLKILDELSLAARKTGRGASDDDHESASLSVVRRACADQPGV